MLLSLCKRSDKRLELNFGVFFSQVSNLKSQSEPVRYFVINLYCEGIDCRILINQFYLRLIGKDRLDSLSNTVQICWAWESSRRSKIVCETTERVGEGSTLTIICNDYTIARESRREPQTVRLAWLCCLIWRFSFLTHFHVLERIVQRDCRVEILQRAEVGGLGCPWGHLLRWLATSGLALSFFGWPGPRACVGNCKGCRHLEDPRERLCGWGRSTLAFLLNVSGTAVIPGWVFLLHLCTLLDQGIHSGRMRVISTHWESSVGRLAK